MQRSMAPGTTRHLVLAAILLASPTLAPAGEPCSYTAISSSANRTCGLLADGTPKCWGSETYDESFGFDVPVDSFIRISVGVDHACGIHADGTVACWGTTCSIHYPSFAITCADFGGPRTPPAGTFTQVSAGGFHTCGLRPGGVGECWGGINEFGQSTVPAGHLYSEISTGGTHTCGLLTGGNIECWGIGNYGETMEPPVDTVPPIDAFHDLAGGAVTHCTLQGDNAVCWGRNLHGETTTPPGPFVQIAPGSEHTCGLHDDGTVECWGRNLSGETMPPPGVFDAISAGNSFTCGLRPGGLVECWGDSSKDATTVADCGICGNGVLADSEECDDNNVTDGDGCDSDCTVTGCGNGIVTTGEACDDGNDAEGDGCDSNCAETACGNGVVSSGEECDDGNLVDGDGSSSACLVSCPPVPAGDCLAAQASKLVIRDIANDANDTLTWKWDKGEQTTALNVPSGSDGFNVCLYADSALTGEVLFRGPTPWDARSRGTRYIDKTGANRGVTKIAFLYGPTGHPELQVRMKGSGMPDDLLPSVSAAIELDHVGGDCWGASFPTGRLKPTSFRARI